MELMMEVAFGFSALAGVMFVKSMICLFEAIDEFKRLIK